MTDKTLNRLISGISLEMKLDKRVIREVAFHPLLFYKRKIESGDMRPMRITFFGAFVPKTKQKNKEAAMKYITERLLNNIESVWDALPVEMYKEFGGLEEFEEAVREAFEVKDKKFLDKLYAYYKEYLKNI